MTAQPASAAPVRAATSELLDATNVLRGRVDVLAHSQIAAINTRFKIGTILEVEKHLVETPSRHGVDARDQA